MNSAVAEQRYLLIVACSQRKRVEPGLLAAIERYDGGSFRLLRKARREGYWTDNLDVFILSAKYGLIEASTPIAFYEQRMTPDRARELRDATTRILEGVSDCKTYREIYVDVGQDYLHAVEGVCVLPSTSAITYAQGRMGERLARLKSWLVAKRGDR